MEAKMAIVEDQTKKIFEQSTSWNNIQHHVQAWGDQMISLDSKVCNPCCFYLIYELLSK